ncbi:MAG TPA: XRE family transcriptional regulator [Blastocatellia bacterium]|nr:XRE family transcriptional regulator [Blastocatellia bacterium]
MEKHVLNSIDPRVIGARLQDARRARGFTQQEVGEQMGMARTTIVAIEKGERQLTPHELIGLAQFYGRPLSEFVGRQITSAGIVPQFRAVARRDFEPDEEFEEATSELQELSENYVELETLCGRPMAKSYPVLYDTSGTSPEDAGEYVALMERNRLGIGDGPLASLRERLEGDVGLRIFFFSMPAKIAGLFFYSDSLGGCIGINSKHPRDRRNWSLTHEYAHFLASRYQIEVTILTKPKPSSARERFAETFAACFLMPSSGLNRRFSELHRSRPEGIILADIVSLANIYQVSVQAIIYRLEDLRRLPVGTWDRLSAEGFKVREAQRELGIDANPPVGDSLPRRYKVLAVMAYRKGDLSEGQLAKMLRTDRVSARVLVDEILDVIHAEDEGEFPSLPLDLALPIGGR